MRPWDLLAAVVALALVLWMHGPHPAFDTSVFRDAAIGALGL